jgi:hypothetical protein
MKLVTGIDNPDAWRHWPPTGGRLLLGQVVGARFVY